MTDTSDSPELASADAHPDTDTEAPSARVAIALIMTILVGLLALAALVSFGASFVGLRMPGWLISLLLPVVCAGMVAGIGVLIWRRHKLNQHAQELLSDDNMRD